jgi:hypothetical protein
MLDDFLRQLTSDHQSEQTQASSRHLANTLMTMYTEFVRVGFTDEQATNLVNIWYGAFSTEFLRGVFAKKDAP